MREHEANIYMYDILEPAKKIGQCVPWSVFFCIGAMCPGQWQAISLGLGAWGGRADGAPDILIYTLLAKCAWCVFCKVCLKLFLQSVLGMIFVLFVLSVIFCTGTTWPTNTMYTMLKWPYATHSAEVGYANSH